MCCGRHLGSELLVDNCGAVAVSYYPQKDKNVCYDSVEKLTDRGLSQCNIHAMICQETFEATKELFNDMSTDPRLEHLNAVIMLSLKQRGRGKCGYAGNIMKVNRLVG